MARQHVSLVFSGGIALGAYQAGAYAALHEHEDLQPGHLAGSSVGAVNAAVIAGTPVDQRVTRLQQFWEEQCVDLSTPADWFGFDRTADWRHAYNWMNVLRTRLFGRAHAFRPMFPELMLGASTTLYHLGPMRELIERYVDFDLLNSGEPRYTVVTTDLETGQEMIFDTARGQRIGADHLVATCGFLPEFPGVEIDGRLLGDGGLVANAPVETVLTDLDTDTDQVCFLVDLFCPEGPRPANLEQAAARRLDLIFGNQTRRTLKGLQREYELRRTVSRLADRLPAQDGVKKKRGKASSAGKRKSKKSKRGLPAIKVVQLSYRAPSYEAGPEKPFDFSLATISERWDAGYDDMTEAIGLMLQSHELEVRGQRGVRLSVWT
jgi:NTE family protein